MYQRMISAALLIGLFTGISTAADWTRFRGPDGTGVSDEKGVVAEWSATKNVVWKTEMPGFGSSTPITLGDKIFLTAYSGYGLDADNPGRESKLMLHVLCIDAKSGKILWTQDVKPILPETGYDSGRIELHGYASQTPVTDGKDLYVFLGKSGVLKYSLDGKEQWRGTVGTGLDKHRWGSGTSPTLYKDLVIVNASCESKSIQALHKDTGKQAWKFDGIVDSWSTPLVVTANGKDELVVIERSKVYGLDPATGKQLWFVSKGNDYACASVIANGDVVYVNNSRFSPEFLAIRLGGRGNVTDSHVVWKKRFTTRVSTMIYHEGHLYGFDFRGYAHCLKADDGKEVFGEDLDLAGGGDKIYASAIGVDGKLIGVSRLDGAVVLELAPKFKEIARNKLDETVFNATPTVHNGRLLIRSDKALYCIGK